MKTHRCEGSLKNELSIRYCKSHEGWNINKNDYIAWRLFENAYDYDYDSHYQSHIAEIKYCPFCGKKLKGEMND